MELDYLNALPLGGFNFDNAIRNKAMAESGILQVPKTMKTGTTICGVLIKVRIKTDLISIPFILALFCLKMLKLILGRSCIGC